MCDRRISLPALALLQPQDVLHGIKARRFTYDPLRCAQSAPCKNFATGRSMCQFQPLAWSGKNHRVLTDHVASAKRRETDLLFATRADLPMAAEHGAIRQRVATALGNGHTQVHRGTGRRIEFVFVVRFDDLDVELSRQRLCRDSH